MTPPKSSLAALTLGAIGVVYGDIGTSPLYAFKEVFHSGSVPLTPENIQGVLSLFFWALTIVVSLKYLSLIMRADNHGEGGLTSLITLVAQFEANRPRLKAILLMVGIIGVALFFSDGIITPAISVLSAIEGLSLITPRATPYVVPITVLVLVALFMVQRRGTGDIGAFFGPITLIWFLAAGGIGLVQVASNPSVLWAISPAYAARFGWSNPGIAFIALGGVFLCVTGAEALYADMGHFGKRPIRLAWFTLVMPALVLNYFGQGALVLAHPQTIENPFFLMAPEWMLIPLVVLATAATVIASQALISGAYSATKQIVQLGYLPRLVIQHTSAKQAGQIYIPAVNWLLLTGVLAAVFLFGSSSALAGAYGMAVSLQMVITTFLTYFIVRHGWQYPGWVAMLATLFFMTIDCVLFAANSTKLLQGGWFPLIVAAGLYVLMATWKDGRELVTQTMKLDALELNSFLEAVFLNPPTRVEGTAVFLTAEPNTVPHALLHNLKHNKVLHENNLFVTVKTHAVPWISMNDRVEIESLGHRCWQVVIHFGYKNDPNVPKALGALKPRGCEVAPMMTSYFVSRDTIIPTIGSGLAPWREKLFAHLHRNASGIADFFELPNNAVVELGSKIEI